VASAVVVVVGPSVGGGWGCAHTPRSLVAPPLSGICPVTAYASARGSAQTPALRARPTTGGGHRYTGFLERPTPDTGLRRPTARSAGGGGGGRRGAGAGRRGGGGGGAGGRSGRGYPRSRGDEASTGIASECPAGCPASDRELAPDGLRCIRTSWVAALALVLGGS
jgi:hypothetical protein